MANIIQQLIQNSVQQAGKQVVKIKDPIATEQQDKYKLRGLNFKSNNPNVMLRDEAGNIVVDIVENNSLLIIEPVTSNILAKSVTKIIDTQFNYFKFPATINVADTELDLDLDLDLNIDQEIDDPIYARYKPIDQQEIPSGGNINFAKEIKNSGADLKFRVKINFRYDSPDNDTNTTYFYITRFRPEAKFADVNYREYFNFETPNAGGGLIGQYNVQESTKEVVIANSEFDVGDTFALNQYKNINEIVNSKTSLSGVRISNKQSEFFSKDLDNSYYFNDKILSRTNESRIEFHIYSNDTWISGNHKVNLLTEKFEYRDKNTNKSIDFPGGQVSINISKQLNDLKINAGNYRVAVNFFENLIGNYERQHLRIDEISSDRTELRLRAIDSDDPEFLQQITAYAQRPLQTSRKFYKTHLLNFSRNKCILFVNSVVIGEFLYVKLYEPLPADILEDFKCWVVEEQKPTFIDNIAIQSVISKKEFNSLSGPNWQANYSYDTSTETGLKSWTDLLGSSVQTSQQLIDTYFSSSFAGIDLNINYRDFNNFIFYSSAQERVENFKYKIDLLEHYSQQNKSI